MSSLFPEEYQELLGAEFFLMGLADTMAYAGFEGKIKSTDQREYSLYSSLLGIIPGESFISQENEH